MLHTVTSCCFKHVVGHFGCNQQHWLLFPDSQDVHWGKCIFAITLPAVSNSIYSQCGLFRYRLEQRAVSILHWWKEVHLLPAWVHSISHLQSGGVASILCGLSLPQKHVQYAVQMTRDMDRSNGQVMLNCQHQHACCEGEKSVRIFIPSGTVYAYICHMSAGTLTF